MPINWLIPTRRCTLNITSIGGICWQDESKLWRHKCTICVWVAKPPKNAFFGGIHIHTCIYICIDVYIHICACVCMCICVWICMCVCICMCTWIWIYLWMCMYVDVDGDLSFKGHVSSLAPADTSPKKIFELFLNLLKSFKKNNKIPGSNFFFRLLVTFLCEKKMFFRIFLPPWVKNIDRFLWPGPAKETVLCQVKWFPSPGNCLQTRQQEQR